MSTMAVSHGRIALPEPKSNEVDFSIRFEAGLVENVLQFLRAEAERQKLDVTLHADRVTYSEGGLIIVPVTWKTNLTTREETKKILALEDAWNEQEPTPVRSVHLADAGNPELSFRFTPPPLNQTV